MERQKKSSSEPLFKSYVFVRLRESQMSLVKQVYGVINFIHFLNKPAIIKEDEIETIKRFNNDYKHVRLQKVGLEINDNVKIIGGPFMNMTGNILNVEAKP